jgi:hypothetical protein
MRSMMDSHPEIMMTPELQFYHSLWRKWRYARAIGKIPFVGEREFTDYALSRNFLDHDEFDRSLFRRLVETGSRPVHRSHAAHALISSFSHRDYAQEAYVGEKTPSTARYVDKLLEDFPDARVVRMIRDPRDCAASWMRAPVGPRTPAPCAIDWWRSIEGFDRSSARLGNRQRSNILDVKYEALVENPVEVLSAVCEHLGVEYSPEMLSFFERDRPGFRQDRYAALHEKSTSPLDNRSVGKWRSSLTPVDLDVIEWIVRQPMLRYGYFPETSVDPSNPRKMLALSNGGVDHLGRALGLDSR